MSRLRLDSLSTPQNTRLLNLLFKHQVYLEGFKHGLALDYQTKLKELYQAFALFFAQNRYSTLDQFSRAQLNEFIRRFERQQQEFYSNYTKRLVDILKRFLAADVKATQSIFEDIASKELPQSAIDSAILHIESNSQLWKNIVDEPNPANGNLFMQEIGSFTKKATAAVTATIMRGYANGWSNEDALRSIVGTASNGFQGGLFARLSAQESSLVSIAVQHLSQNAQAVIGGKVAKQYQWVAVLDNRTTAICLSRNGNIYVYGEGPLPPAHYNCRSFIVPVANQKLVIPSDWDISRFGKALTVSEFEQKIKSTLVA